jgi:hypothetical protein
LHLNEAHATSHIACETKTYATAVDGAQAPQVTSPALATVPTPVTQAKAAIRVCGMGKPGIARSVPQVGGILLMVARGKSWERSA